MPNESKHKLSLYVEAHDEASEELKGIAQSAGAVADEGGLASSVIGGLTDKFVQLGAMAAAAGAAARIVTGAWIDTAGQFEQAIANVSAVASATDTQLDAMAQHAVKLGASTVFTASQAAQGMKFLAMTGYNAQQIIAGIGPALDLAAASGMDLARTADILSNIITGFGLRAENAQTAANALAVVAANANTNIEQLGEAMKYAANTAAAAGVTINEAAAVVGVLGDSGIQASMAGTNLRGMLVSLAKPTAKAQKALSDLGVEIARRKDGSIDLAQTFQRLKEANWSLSDATAIFNRRVASGAIALSQNYEKLRALEYQSRSNVSTLASMRDVMLETYEGAWVKLNSALDGLSTTLGKHLLPAMTRMVAALTAVVRGIKYLADAFPPLTFVVTNAFNVFGLLLAAVGGLGLAIGILGKGIIWLAERTLFMYGIEKLRQVGITKTIEKTYEHVKALADHTAGLLANQAATKAAGTDIKEAASTAEEAMKAVVKWGGEFGRSLEKVASKYGVVGAALHTLLAPLAGLGIGFYGAAKAVYTFVKTAGLVKTATAAFQGVRLAMVALFGTAGALPVAIIAIASAIGIYLIRELTGVGALIRANARELEAYRKQVAETTATIEGLKRGYKDLNGNLIELAFYLRSVEDLQKMNPAAIEQYGAQLRAELERMKAQFNALIKERENFEAGEDPEYMAITDQMYQLNELIMETETATRALKRFKAGDVVDTEALSGAARESEEFAKTLGESADVAREKLDELEKKSGKAARKIGDEFYETKKEITRFSEDLARELQKSGEEWTVLAQKQDASLEDVDAGFKKFLGALQSKSKSTVALMEAKFRQAGRAIEEAIRKGASSGELLALKENIKSVADVGIQAFRSLRDRAGDSLKSLKQDYQRTLEEIERLTERSERERLEITQLAADTTRGINRRTLTEEEKYYETKRHLQNRLKQADDLEAKGDEESIKRAQVIRQEVIQEAKALDEVKKNKRTIISQEEANADALEIVNQAKKDYLEASKAAEEAAKKELEEKKKALEEQIQKLEELKKKAEEAMNELRKEVRVKIDMTDIEVAHAKLQEMARKEYVVKLEAEAEREEAFQRKQERGGLDPSKGAQAARAHEKRQDGRAILSSDPTRFYKYVPEEDYKVERAKTLAGRQFAGTFPAAAATVTMVKMLAAELGVTLSDAIKLFTGSEGKSAEDMKAAAEGMKEAAEGMEEATKERKKTGMATGGQVPGTGTGDTVPAMLTPGEFVIRKDAVNKYGRRFLEMLNNMALNIPGFAGGGLVGSSVFSDANAGLWREIEVMQLRLIESARAKSEEVGKGMEKALGAMGETIKPGYKRPTGHEGQWDSGVSEESVSYLDKFAETLAKLAEKFEKGQQINIKINSDGSATLTGGGNVDLLG